MPPAWFPPFTTPVRGHRYAGRPPGITGLRDLEALRLVREADNPRDPLAVAVWGRAGEVRWRIGYLERAVARRLAPRMDRGLALDVTPAGWLPEPAGRWQRPAVRIAIAAGGAAPSSAPEDRLHGHERPGREQALHDGVVDAA